MRAHRAVFLVAILLGPLNAEAAQHWGEFKPDHCTGFGTRQYSAILWEIPWNTSWEAACAGMPADIEGHHFDSPSRCAKAGGHMWGEFEVPSDDCPHWGTFQKDQCSGIGKRQYSAVLHDIASGLSWESACTRKGAEIQGQRFSAPARCRNTGLGMWGEFDVRDEDCKPRWGTFRKDHCTGEGRRQYSAVIHNVPQGVSWEAACAQSGANLEGRWYTAPARCKHTGIEMWGEFDVIDATCRPPHWGPFEREHCTAPGRRQFSAVLHDIPVGASWEQTCAATAAVVEGASFTAPSRCRNTGLAMWGEFDVPDASCAARWGPFRKEHCTAPGARQHTSVLAGIPAGMSWEVACANTPATIAGVSFTSPSRCVNKMVAMWGEFDVPDASCTPASWGRWGDFKRGHCTGVGVRQFSAALKDIPAGIRWETACSQMGAEFDGQRFDAPARCVHSGLEMWGEFDVPDEGCRSQFWGPFKRDHCTDSGRRQYSAVLRNIPRGVSWEDACAQTAATISGVTYARPARCKNERLLMWGEFEVRDATCNPITECSDANPPPDSVEKRGNDGSVSCDAFCANAGGNWGARGTCAKGRMNSGPNAGSCLTCIEKGLYLAADDVSCFCKPLLTGIADTHNHQFANLGFGGMAIWGKPFGRIDQALPHCTPAHGPGGLGDLMFDTVRQMKLLPWTWGHLVGGYPQFDGWPRYTSSSHQAVYEDWLHRAYQGGLRLMVMLAVNNEEACGGRLIRPESALFGSDVKKAPGRTCDDAEAIRHQIGLGTEGAKAMERYIDAKHGGPGRGWYRIVYSAAEARSAIAADKLAVVLGAEVDFFLNCRTDADCTEADVRERLGQYHRMGLRHIFPIHFRSNGFGGAALSHSLTHGPSRDCSSEGYETNRNLIDPFDVACSSHGLTNIGKFLFEELIRRKMIIDIDHLSFLAREDAFKIVEREKYPVVSSHTGFFDISKGKQKHEGNLKADEVRRIRELGGLISVIQFLGDRDTIITYRGEGVPVVEHQCGGTSQTFAQGYLYAVEKMKGGAVGIGTDFNAGPDLPGPRFGSDNCRGGGPTVPQTARVHYPFPVSVKGSPTQLDRSVVGNKHFDINLDGLAHVGMLPDFIEDLKQQGLRPEDLEPLFRSAEAYVKIWEEIDKRP